MADLIADFVLADDADDVDPVSLDAVSARGRMFDRLADIMLIAEEVRELAEVARVQEPDFPTIDRLMQHFFDETNLLMQRFAD
jgi:hypothetical protein